MEESVVVTEELPSLLLFSGSSVVDGTLIISIARFSCSHHYSILHKKVENLLCQNIELT